MINLGNNVGLDRKQTAFVGYSPIKNEYSGPWRSPGYTYAERIWLIDTI
jgi:hypothetical protein